MIVKQEPQLNRPQISHRLSMTSTSSSNLPTRHATTRHHSHSVSLGAVNASHRITRRKSLNASAVNNAAAIAAAINDIEKKGPVSSKRGSLNLKTTLPNSRGLESSKQDRSSGDYSLGGFPDNSETANEEAMDDEDSGAEGDFLPTETLSTASKARARRASEGSYLTKTDGKRSSGELRCDKCGKGYKHSSCLTKHLSVLSGPTVIQLFAIVSQFAPVSLVVSMFLGTRFTPTSKSFVVDSWCLQVGAHS